MKHDDKNYPEIEWTDEMIEQDQEFLNDPVVQKALEATEETLEEAPFDSKAPTVH